MHGGDGPLDLPQMRLDLLVIVDGLVAARRGGGRARIGLPRRPGHAVPDAILAGASEKLLAHARLGHRALAVEILP